MRTVLMIAYYYPPDSSSGVYRTLYFANHLIKTKNWQPIVLTPNPAFYSWEQSKDYSLLKKNDPDIQIVRTKCLQLREKVIGMCRRPKHKCQNYGEAINESDASQKRLFQKIIDIVTEEILAFPDRQVGWIPYAIREGIRIARKHNVDVIYSSGSPWSSFLIGCLLKRILKIPLVLDYRDPWNQNTFLEPRSRLYLSISKKLEVKILGNANAVICNTNSLKDVIVKNCFHLEKEKFYVIPNGFEEEDLAPENLEKIEKQKNGFTFIHTGNLYGNRNIDNFILAVKCLAEESLLNNSKFILIGAKEDAKQNIIDKGSEVLFRKYFLVMDRIEHQKCITYLKNSDCFLLFQQGTHLQMPRKIYEYIALKKPILAITPEKGDTSKLIVKNKLGIVVDDNVNEICKGIMTIIDKHDEFVEHIENNNAFVKYNNRKLAEDLKKVFHSVTKT